MAIYHVNADVISKGQGAQDFAIYLLRLDVDHASQHRRYLEREAHSREDLVASGSQAMPRWATDAEHFWQQAEHYERGGTQRAGVVARTYQFTIPRELSDQARLALADDVLQAFFARYPHTWAVHNPDNQPHLHVMFSTRREDTPSERTPEAWFRGAGRVQKDRHWDQKQTLQGVRYEYAILANVALEREGHQVAISPQRLSVRGAKRDPELSLPRAQVVLMKKYAGVELDAITKTKDRVQVEQAREAMAILEVNRALLHHHYHPRENARNLEAWQAQKQREHLTDLSREAVLDHVRDRFWRYDRSPAREHERLASLERAINREYARTGRERSPEQERQASQRRPRPERMVDFQRESERDLDKRWERPLLGNKVSGIYHTPEQANYGDVSPRNQVRFWTERAAQEAGYRRAANDHYGPGSGIAQEGRNWPRGIRDRRRTTQGRTTACGLGLDLEDTQHGGAQVRLQTREEEHEWQR